MSMSDTLVSFETAKIAKEKGFQIGTKNVWDFHGIPKINESSKKDCLNWNKLEKGAYCSAPTQSLLQRWLREVHNIFVYVDSTGRPHIRDKDEKLLAEVKINNKYAGFKYEEALENGLYQALLIMKKL